MMKRSPLIFKFELCIYGQKFEISYLKICNSLKMTTSRVRQSYKMVNGCKRQIECQQLFWVFGEIVILILYSAFVVPPIVQWNNVALIIFMTVFYVLLVPILYDYCRLTCTDPVDPNILSQQSYGSSQQVKNCSICKLEVKRTTEHCLNCQRCTDKMDHHSQLINNCISLNNISNYIRLNICFCLSVAIMLAESTAIFMYSFSDSELNSYIANKWIILLLILFSFVTFAFSFANTIFSCYLRSRNMTRIDYQFRDTDSNNSDYSDSDHFDEEMV